MTLTRKQKRIMGSTLRTIFGIILGLVLAMPFIWMIICSFQETASDIYAYPPKLPNFLNFKNFAFYLTDTNFLKQL